MNNKKTSSFNQGYSKYTKEAIKSSLTTDDESVLSKSKEKEKMNKYPKGYLSVFFISLITVATFLLYYFVPDSNSTEDFVIPRFWQDAFACAFGVGFFCNLIWLTSRQLFSLRSKYMGKRMLEYFTFKPYREKKNLVFRSWASNNIQNFDEYIQFCQKRKKSTALVFYISITVFTVLFIVGIILCLTLPRVY